MRRDACAALTIEGHTVEADERASERRCGGEEGGKGREEAVGSERGGAVWGGAGRRCMHKARVGAHAMGGGGSSVHMCERRSMPLQRALTVVPLVYNWSGRGGGFGPWNHVR